VKWSWKIAEVCGIGIYVHATFLLLLGWLMLAAVNGENATWHDGLREGVFVVLVFAIVVLHELGHAFAALHYGIRTRDITLLPIGGIARLERMPEDPRQELTVAIAGPAVNLVLAGGLFVWLVLAGLRSETGQPALLAGDLLARLFWVNMVLFVFNLLPAFPMDGGRVLRALLGLWMDHVQATQLAAGVGQLMAVGLGLLGLFLNPLLLLIALFIWVGASQEANHVRVKAALTGIPVYRTMVREFRSLSPTDSLQTASEHILAGFQYDFPVVEDGKLIGVLTRSDLLAALAKEGPAGLVGNVMEREFEVADPGEMLDVVLQRLQECECRTLPVLHEGQLVGMITVENLGEFLMIQSALRSHQG
jgi:Zn-dependent protease/CBS domain-containing protein